MKRHFLLLSLLMLGLGARATEQPERPKLVVGIVVDQMRWDYIYRYADRYCEGGFRRMLSEGYSCENCRLPYIPSVTAIGHASIYTGSVPSIHGIAGNNFKIDGRTVYCTDDATVKPVGSSSAAGKMSPANLWATTIGDELRLATNMRSKVVGVALKDRAAILPAGRNPSGAYWFDYDTGGFITSSYYMDALPKWVNDFNKQDKAREYLSHKWETLYDKSTYIQSTADDTPYEDGIMPGVKATLPLDLPGLYKKYGYKLIRRTPFGCDLTIDMAKAAIEGEKLGEGDDTDMLCVSFSSTDYIGHIMGLRAIETEDCYLRLDRALADFFSYLDKRVGKGNYLAFLSADHAGMDQHQYLADHRIPGAIWNYGRAAKGVDSVLQVKYPQAGKLVLGSFNYQIFFDEKRIDSLGLDYSEVKAEAVKWLKKQPQVLYAADQEKLSEASIPSMIKEMAINGYNRDRSGSVLSITKPGQYDGWTTGGTTHGMWNNYDTHIPLLFMGWGITHGATTRPVKMTDIAPTVCALLHIQAPSGCIGEPIF